MISLEKSQLKVYNVCLIQTKQINDDLLGLQQPQVYIVQAHLNIFHAWIVLKQHYWSWSARFFSYFDFPPYEYDGLPSVPF